MGNINMFRNLSIALFAATVSAQTGGLHPNGWQSCDEDIWDNCASYYCDAPSIGKNTCSACQKDSNCPDYMYCSPASNSADRTCVWKSCSDNSDCATNLCVDTDSGRIC